MLEAVCLPEVARLLQTIHSESGERLRKTKRDVMKNLRRANRQQLVLDGAIALLALGWLGMWTPDGSYPGDSAAWLAAVSGVDPFPPLTRPLYTVLAGLLSKISVGRLSDRMAALSVVFGVVTAVGIIRLVNARPLNLRGKEAWAQVVSGLAAAGVLLISVPFTLASTRASPYPVALACGMGALVFIAHGA